MAANRAFVRCKTAIQDHTPDAILNTPRRVRAMGRQVSAAIGGTTVRRALSAARRAPFSFSAATACFARIACWCRACSWRAVASSHAAMQQSHQNTCARLFRHDHATQRRWSAPDLHVPGVGQSGHLPSVTTHGTVARCAHGATGAAEPTAEPRPGADRRGTVATEAPALRLRPARPSFLNV